MKLYSVSIPAKDIEIVYDVLMSDLAELWLEGDEIRCRSAVCCAYHEGKNNISFELTEKQALLLMQTLFIYSKRLAEAGDDRQYPFFDFAVSMFTPLTGRTEHSF